MHHTPMTPSKHRFVTRADLDGLACAVMLEELELIDEMRFVHAQDVLDGSVEITERDITANLPYSAAAHRAFEYGPHALTRNTAHLRNHVIDPHATSAARLMWLHYGGAFSMPNVSESLLRAVDQASSADYRVEDVLHPQGWTLLNFILDARTGLGRFRTFGISNYQLMHSMVASMRTLSVDRILTLPDVKERVDLYTQHEGPSVDQLLAASTVHGNVVVLDLCEQDPIWATNRFMIYALFPQCNLVIRRMWGRDRRNIVFALGKSIFERNCITDVGQLCGRFGGNGHPAAGSCQVEIGMAERVLADLLDAAHHDESSRVAALRGPDARR
jgi:nanoRNase/pAp phosphatase (c-di-AMP/oligoRNAs hydrolase)